MSYFAKASRTGVEKVAVAIASTRPRSALQGLQGVQGRVRTRWRRSRSRRRLQLSALQVVQGRDAPSLPAQPVAAAAGRMARSGSQQRSSVCETQLWARAAIIGPS